MNRSIHVKANRPSQYLLPLLALSFAVPVFAGDQDQLKCGANQDRVWVYDTLATMDVGAHLKCNESVEIVSRVKGYVKIRSASGAEGYVPDSSLPDLPPLPDPDDKMVAAGGPVPASGGGASLAAAAKAAIAAANKPVRAVSTASSVAVPVPALATPAPIATPPPAPQRVAIAGVQSPAATPAPVAIPAPVAAPVPAIPPVAEPVAVAPVTSAPVTVVAAAKPVPPVASVAPVSVSTRAVAPTPVANPGAAQISTVASDATTASAPVKQAAKSPKHSKPAPATTPATVPPPAPVAEARLDAPAPARTYAVRDVVTSPRTATIKTASDKTAEVPIGAEYPDTEPENESADPACHAFFSAYGLSPSQFKWLAANRQKLYPGICPAPNLASVDFVVLFTHDSDTYNAAMPTPVHTDSSGFSDFNPLTEIDTALLSGSDADHARREYVWVFRMRRGGFDPMKFSPRRRPQFSTESKGSAHAIEDAFNYLQEQGQGTRLEANQ